MMGFGRIDDGYFNNIIRFRLAEAAVLAQTGISCERSNSDEKCENNWPWQD